MPGKFYKRGWHHGKSRGSERSIFCSYCGRAVPKYKTFSVMKEVSIRDPMIKQELGIRGHFGLPIFHNKMYACPACARHRNIVRKKR